MVNKSNILDWDSKFFSFKVASIEMNNSDDAFLEKKLAEFDKKGAKLVYLFISDGLDINIDRFRNKFKINLVDKKRAYRLNVLEDVVVSDAIYNYSGSSSDIYDLAIQAGWKSRFNNDPDFPYDIFVKLYKTWIDKSIKGIMADYFLCYKSDNGDILGFITIQNKINYLSIGLFAANSNYRRRGIGTSLLDAAKHIAYMSHLPLEVVTQSDNEQACNCYEKVGFKKISQSLVYHIWKNSFNKNI